MFAFVLKRWVAQGAGKYPFGSSSTVVIIAAAVWTSFPHVLKITCAARGGAPSSDMA
jgi:hypothetical protein